MTSPQTKTTGGADCSTLGHDFSRSKTVPVDAYATKTKRVYYCSFCGTEKPSRAKTAAA